MRLFFIFALFSAVQVTAKISYGQEAVTLNLKNEPLEKALKEITRQTGYSFIYTRAQLKHTNRITIQLKSAPLKDALNSCFLDQPVSYTIEDRYVIVLDRPDSNIPPGDTTITVSGKVVGENGDGLLRISISAVKSKKGTYTNENGEFILQDIPENEVLIFTSVGYNKEEIAVRKKSFITVVMKQSISMLDETVIMAYGKTSRRFNTGNISKVSSEEIAQQPVSDPLATLHGKVPGLVVTQSSGIPGSSIRIQIRGQNSLAQGSEPLIIVDGVPFAANNQPINNLQSILASGISPIATINPADIESVEVLKDADATAIYGSRGANGVVLITTKKGQAGKTQIFANFYTGLSRLSKLPEMLNTRQYIEMRREAIANDGFTPNTSPLSGGYAPDLLLWDTTRETNFSKMYIGNTTNIHSTQAGISGGKKNINFFLSTGYNKEGTVLSKSMGIDRISFNNNISYNSDDYKLSIRLTSNYSYSKNNLIDVPFYYFLTLPPNLPPIYTSEGKLNWEQGGYYFNNPEGSLLKKYYAGTENLLGNLQIAYKMTEEITLRSSFGYNSIQVAEESRVPIAAQSPRNNPYGKLNVSDNYIKSWIVEPQAEYETKIGNGKLNILVGSTFSQNRQDAHYISADGYQSDNLLTSLSGATSLNAESQFSDYKYMAIFGRANYNLNRRYILNLTGRRDGSSRFGPANQLANFGAVGAAWLFQEENYIQKKIPFLSFGKFRVSYGITGNDQIGNYKYLDTWSIYYNSYQGNTALYPTGLFNPNYGWETNKKFEMALDLGLFKDRIYLSISYFNNRSGNQLVNYSIPEQTGFTDVIRNFPALVQNRGFELLFTAIPLKSEKLVWEFSANVSLPSNKLLSFKDFASSTYRSNYVLGESLNAIYKLRYLGIDPKTGIFTFEDANNDNTISLGVDYSLSGNTDPKYYGGLQNRITFKKFELNVFFDFKKQIGSNYLKSIYSSYYIPGFISNQPSYILNRWQKEGDVSEIPKLTTVTYNDAYSSKLWLLYSNGIYSDASFIRLKTVFFSWQFPHFLLSKTQMADSKIFISAQNLFTVSKYKGTDPEIQNYYAMPILRTIAVGIRLNF